MLYDVIDKIVSLQSTLAEPTTEAMPGKAIHIFTTMSACMGLTDWRPHSQGRGNLNGVVGHSKAER